MQDDPIRIDAPNLPTIHTTEATCRSYMCAHGHSMASPAWPLSHTPPHSWQCLSSLVVIERLIVLSGVLIALLDPVIVLVVLVSNGRKGPPLLLLLPLLLHHLVPPLFRLIRGRLRAQRVMGGRVGGEVKHAGVHISSL